MGKVRPCFGLSLQSGTEVIGWIDIINSSLVIIYHIMKWVTSSEYHSWFNPFLAYFIAIDTLCLGMGCLLLLGSAQRNSFICICWISFTFIHCIATVCGTSFYTSFLIDSGQSVSITGMIIIVSYFCVCKPYCCWVVWTFVNEIKTYRGLNATLRNLNNTEVEEFLYGTLEEPTIQCNPLDKICRKKETKVHVELMSHPFCKKPYDRNYEVNLSHLSIDKDNVLGSGMFGIIYKATILFNEPERKDVAVKTIKPNSDVEYFKALLTELKIMIYLGEHPNLVNLIGVSTGQIQQKSILIVLEWCELGSLHDFLRINSTNRKQSRISVNEMQTWGFQIANGLSYLEEKNVIHGDIAARNILLTIDKIAKVADFGFSKKLYRYSSCERGSSDLPLPWRWMAIETLEKLEFSLKSDVWSFGVTLWEIFNWAEIPFCRMNWTSEFVQQLIKGLRLNQPEETSDEIYLMMKRCWNLKPEERPTFSELAEFLKQIVQAQNNPYKSTSDSLENVD